MRRLHSPPFRLAAVAALAASLYGCGSRQAPPPAPVPEPAPAVTDAPSGPALPPAPPEAGQESMDGQTRDRRSILLTDMTRLGLVRALEQGPPGVIRVAIGEQFYAAGNRSFYFGKLATAYYAWTEPGRPLVIELWDQGRKFGEFAEGTFLVGPEYATPRGCDAACVAAVPTGGPPVTPTRPAAAVVAPAAAEPTGHGGVHVTLGIAKGWLKLSCKDCSDLDREGGLSGYASVAIPVGNRTFIGVESTGWTKERGSIRARGYSLTLNATNYLNEPRGLFVSAGLGLVGYTQRSLFFGSTTATGFGLSGRIGAEVGLGRHLVVVPFAGIITSLGGAELGSTGVDIKTSNLQLGVGLGVH
ncbi:MAG TPA: hypothetical protein VMY76_12835 [Gemmatimonadales bacterium]|nr:hypothetical protein [Gemmatimonadales bacterium]